MATRAQVRGTQARSGELARTEWGTQAREWGTRAREWGTRRIERGTRARERGTRGVDRGWSRCGVMRALIVRRDACMRRLGGSLALLMSVLLVAAMVAPAEAAQRQRLVVGSYPRLIRLQHGVLDK